MNALMLVLSMLQAAPEPAAGPDVAALAWMTGSWGASEGATDTEEHWTAPKAGTLLGMNRTTRGGKTAMFEFLRIEARPDGIFYMASPGGRPPTPFKLKEAQKERAVFENPEHDFPQRVLYWKDGASLCARIEGTRKGKPASQEWCWKPLR
jgi:hypothetical protein